MLIHKVLNNGNLILPVIQRRYNIIIYPDAITVVGVYPSGVSYIAFYKSLDLGGILIQSYGFKYVNYKILYGECSVYFRL